MMVVGELGVILEGLPFPVPRCGEGAGFLIFDGV
jgi:hypothetical protein